MSASTTIHRDEVPVAVREGPEQETLRDQAGRLYRRAKEQAIQQERVLEDYVREHPMKSVLVAAGLGAGVGLLAGVLLSRR